jgi:hypothetical protein
MDLMDTNRVAAGGRAVAGRGKSGQALQFNGDNLAVLKGSGEFNRTSVFSLACGCGPPGPGRAVIFIGRGHGQTLGVAVTNWFWRKCVLHSA